MDLIKGDVNENKGTLNNICADSNASEIDLIIQNGLMEISTQVRSLIVRHRSVFLFL